MRKHLIEFDESAFHPRKIMAIRHHMSDHPLLQLGALVDLARRLPPKLVRAHAAQVAKDTNFEWAPTNHPIHTPIDQAVANIEKSGSWIAYHNVQVDPTYSKLMDELLGDVLPRVSKLDPGMHTRAFWIFIQSPNSVTPFHIDHENNFIMQLQGKKRIQVWDPLDRTITPEEALEVFHSEHSRRAHQYDPSVEAKAVNFDAEPGVGAYMPATAPHAVQNLDNVSITMSVTYMTKNTKRLKTLHRGNALLRRKGITPSPVGQSPVRDAVKHFLFRSYLDARGALLNVPELTTEVKY